MCFFFFSSRRRHTRYWRDWSSDVCSSDLCLTPVAPDRTHVECEWLFSREALASEGFDPSYATEFWHITNGQDWRAGEARQRGVSSRGHRQGALSPQETTVGRVDRKGTRLNPR